MGTGGCLQGGIRGILAGRFKVACIIWRSKGSRVTEKAIITSHSLYEESKKMIQMNLFIKQKYVALLVAQGVESACSAGDLGSVLGGEDPLKKGMAIHSSSLTWRIPWSEKASGYSPSGHKESDTTEGLTLSLSQTRNKDLSLFFFKHFIFFFTFFFIYFY